MSAENNVPAIRFKGFDGEWEKKLLGAIAEVKTGPFGSTLHAEDYVEDGEPIITTEHFKSGALPKNKIGIPQVSNKDYSRLNAYLLKLGDIVFSRVGSVDINAHVTSKQKGWLFSGRVLRVRTTNSIDSEFLHHELSTSRVKKSVVTRAVGQTMPSINTEILKITPVYLPVETIEQTKIGNYFQQLDTLIAQHQKKHDKLLNLKKALLEKMFPKQGTAVPEIRFKGFSGEWEEKKLYEVCQEFQSGKFIKAEDIKVEGAYPVYGGNALRGYTDSYNYDGTYALIGRQGALCGNMSLSTNKAYFTEHAIAVKSNSYSNTTYLFHLLGIMKLGQYSGQSAQPGLAVNKLIELRAYFPSTIEQTKIGNLFKHLDTLLTQHQAQLKKLNNIKQACLEKMFV